MAEHASTVASTAATAIQSHWRGARQRAQIDHALGQIDCVVAMQAAWRATLARHRVHALSAARAAASASATQIQAAFRGSAARRRAAAAEAEGLWLGTAAASAAAEHAAASRLQAQVRGRMARDDLLIQHVAAVGIQSRWRGHTSRHLAQRPAQLPAAVAGASLASQLEEEEQQQGQGQRLHVAQAVRVTVVGASGGGGGQPRHTPQPVLTLVGPRGETVRLNDIDVTYVAGRGVLGLPDRSRLHRKHVRIHWAGNASAPSTSGAPGAAAGCWVVQRLGKNPCYVQRRAQLSLPSSSSATASAAGTGGGGVLQKLPPPPASLELHSGDVIFLSKVEPSLALAVQLTPSVVERVAAVQPSAAPAAADSATEHRATAAGLGMAPMPSVSLPSTSPPPSPSPASDQEAAKGLKRLVEACIAGAYPLVVSCLAAVGDNLNARDEMGCTGMWYAAGLGHGRVVELLLRKGAAADILCEGSTPLCVAAIEGHAQVIRVLTDGGAQIDLVDGNGATPLLLACTHGHVGAANVLLEAGAMVGVVDTEGNTPCAMAASKGHTDAVSLLLQNGADPSTANAEGMAPLHLAAMSGHVDIVQHLLHSGADASALTAAGHSAAELAAAQRRESALELLSRHQLRLGSSSSTTQVSGGSSALPTAHLRGQGTARKGASAAGPARRRATTPTRVSPGKTFVVTQEHRLDLPKTWEMR
jgi:ankyrin repeat protein